jgi:hypothetical protein
MEPGSSTIEVSTPSIYLCAPASPASLLTAARPANPVSPSPRCPAALLSCSPGKCLRCRANAPAVFLIKNPYVGFSLNLCQDCMLLALDDPTVKSLRGRGSSVWAANLDVPRHFYLDLEAPAHAPDREALILQRGREARYYVRMGVKLRRNEERLEAVKRRAAEYGVLGGVHISWGFEAFDEYYGAVDEKGKPHGLGVKVYSDESVYVGGWMHGARHTLKTGLWTRPDGSQYEGSWMNGFKHGSGMQTFPNGSRYKGEFAKGYEHGHGSRKEVDGWVFEGRFRFGKKDGPGTLTSPEKVVEKRVFKEAFVFHEKPLPPIEEDHFDTDIRMEQDTQCFEPDSLMALCISALARAMHSHKSLVPSTLLHRRLPVFMKPWMGIKYLSTIHPRGSPDFLQAAPHIAFTSCAAIDLRGVRFLHFDCETFLYFTAANTLLTSLNLSMCRLDAAALDMLIKKLSVRSWPKLHTLDLSFNRLDVMLVRKLVKALRSNKLLKTLKLAGCNVDPAGAAEIA